MSSVNGSTALQKAHVSSSSTTNVVSVKFASEFATEVQYDWSVLNGLPQCGNSSVFYGKQNLSGAYICQGSNGTGTPINTMYSGQSTEQIVTGLYPDVFTTYNQIWSEEYAVMRNGPVQGLDTYLHGFSNYFNCSYQYLNTAEQLGRKPITTDFTNTPGTCPALASPPTIVVGTNSYPAQCYQVFTSAGGSNDYSAPSYGYVFYCGSVTQNNGDSVGQNLWYLKPAFRTTLSKANAYAYLFTSRSEYVTIMTASGEMYGDPSGAVAITYPNGPAGGTLAQSIWYTMLMISLEPDQNDQISYPRVVFTATHEFGHTFDDTRATPPSAGMIPSSMYDLAMQHDWLTLDYTSYTSPTVNTPRAPCALSPQNGPLVNIIDKNTQAQFCNGSGGYIAGSTWAGNNPNTGKPYLYSEIVQDPSEYGNVGYPAIYQTTGANSPKVGGNPGYQTVAGWREWHSEALAITAQQAEMSTPYIATFSGVRANGYYACTAGATTGWAALELSTGAALTAANAPCQTPMPTGWVAIY